MPRRFDFVSPGVQLNEIDLSTVPAQLQGDGPLIIGRAQSGPANQPIKVKSYSDYVSVFGEPVYGPDAAKPDSWRYGQSVFPEYGAIGAQAWLAADDTPITFIRLLGEQDSNAVPAGYAGWQTEKYNNAAGGDFAIAARQNGGAFGLFIIDSGSAKVLGTGSLAAVWYLDQGTIELSGTACNMPTSVNETGSARLFQSRGGVQTPNTYTVLIKNASGSASEAVSFNFNPDSNNFIRNQFNTEPYKTNPTTETVTSSYWLGETYEVSVDSYTQNTTAGKQIGVILGLGSGSINGANNRFGYTGAKTGWFINRDPNPSPQTGSYQAINMEKLFRVVALQEGEFFQRNYTIAIEDLKLGTAANPDSTFSLSVRRFNNNFSEVEKFSGLTMNPNSENFIAKRIGDQYLSWQEDQRKFNTINRYPNISDYIRIEMAPALQNGVGPQDEYALPFGFFGPNRFKGFTCTSGSSTINRQAGAGLTPFAVGKGPFVLGSGSIPMCNGADAIYNSPAVVMGDQDNEPHTLATASFDFPSIKLTATGTYGISGGDYPALVSTMFGIHPYRSASIKLDNSYIDLIRALPQGYDIWTEPASDAALETSFIFSLDEIRLNSNTNTAYYQSGSRAAGNSYSGDNSQQALLTKNVKQFMAPIFGGFDGLDIKQKDPFANSLIGTVKTSNYEFATLNKALDIASDSENVAMDLLAIPGVGKQSITDRMIKVCDERADSLAIIDLDTAYTTSAESTTESAGSVTSVVSTVRTRNYDSSYGCVYHPWILVQNPGANGTNTYVPSSIAGLGAMAASQKVSAVWFAPAGFNRGGIAQLGGPNGPRTIGVSETLNKANRDDLYEVDINPIANFQGDPVIFGQKTLQAYPSSLDRINVRRLMIYIKKRINTIADTVLFDQNIEATWRRFSGRATRVLRRVQTQGGIEAFKIVLDKTTTTPDLQDRNIMYAKIFIKPAKAIEFIAIDFIITRSGVQF